MLHSPWVEVRHSAPLDVGTRAIQLGNRGQKLGYLATKQVSNRPFEVGNDFGGLDSELGLEPLDELELDDVSDGVEERTGEESDDGRKDLGKIAKLCMRVGARRFSAVTEVTHPC